MRRLFIILSLTVLACGIPVQISPTVTPKAIPSATELPTVTPLPTVSNLSAKVKMPTVNVRDEPDGNVIGSLSVGKTVEIISCVGNWCKIKKPAGYVFRGCLDVVAGKLKCQAK